MTVIDSHYTLFLLTIPNGALTRRMMLMRRDLWALAHMFPRRSCNALCAAARHALSESITLFGLRIQPYCDKIEPQAILICLQRLIRFRKSHTLICGSLRAGTPQIYTTKGIILLSYSSNLSYTKKEVLYYANGAGEAGNMRRHN